MEALKTFKNKNLKVEEKEERKKEEKGGGGKGRRRRRRGREEHVEHSSACFHLLESMWTA